MSGSAGAQWHLLQTCCNCYGQSRRAAGGGGNARRISAWRCFQVRSGSRLHAALIEAGNRAHAEGPGRGCPMEPGAPSPMTPAQHMTS